MLDATLTEDSPQKERMHASIESAKQEDAKSLAAATEQKRDLLFDGMKGFGILLVITGHALQGSSEKFDDIFAFRMIYSFHMPLFFFISGYLFQAGLRKKLLPLSFVLKKARALVVPFLSWYVIFGLWRGLPPDVTLSNYIIRFLRSPDYGYWFLWTLFLCFVSFLPLAWLQQRLNAKWHAVLILLSYLCFHYLRTLPTGQYGIGPLKMYYSYFAVGYFVCCWRKHLSLLKNWWPEVSIVGFLLLVPYWRRPGLVSFRPYLDAHFPTHAATMDEVLIFALALFGIGFVAQIVKWLIPGRIANCLAWIGHYTLDIYVIHLYTFQLVPFSRIFAGPGDTFNIAMDVAWGLGASLAISFLVLRRSVVLKFLFLGIVDSKKKAPPEALTSSGEKLGLAPAAG